MKFTSKKPGYAIVEILLAIAIFVASGTAITYLLIDAGASNLQAKDRVLASTFAEVGLEAARNIRDSGWDNLTPNKHGLVLQNGAWAFFGESDSDPTGRFSRQVNVTAISADRMLVTSSVSWTSATLRPMSISFSTYLNNWSQITSTPEPLPWTQPKTLGVVGYMDVSSQGHRNPNDIFVLGNYVYIGTSEGNQVGAEFYVFDISDPAKPLLVGSCVIGAQIQAVIVVGNFAYLATNDHNAELTILDISNPTNPQKVSGVNVPGNAVGKDIAINGNYVYLTTNNNPSGKELYIIDVTDPLNPGPNPIGSLELGCDINAVSISGNYAYVGTNNDSKEIQIINISNPSVPTIVKTFDNLGPADATDILINNNNLYLTTTNNGTTNPDFVIFSVNTDNPLLVIITIVGQMQLAGDINGLALDSADKQVFLATSISNKQFFIADIANPALPTEKASLALPDTAVAVAYNGTYAYVADIANGQELVIIGPSQ